MLTGVAGSMAYMAPEILAKRGYTYPIDWWSLGVCLYELIFGRRVNDILRDEEFANDLEQAHP